MAENKHSALFIGRSGTYEILKRHFVKIQNLDMHHVEAAKLEDLRAHHADVVVIEQLGNHENTCAILEEINMRFPDSVVLLQVSEKPAPDKLIQYMNYGTRDIFGSDDNPEQVLRKAVMVLERRVNAQHGEAVRAGRVAVFFSSKGGIGKSFLSVCMGRILGHHPEFRTILVDLDLQFGDIDLYLAANSSMTIAEVVEEAHNNSNRLTDFILDSNIHKIGPSLHILSAPLSPEKADLINAQDIAGLIKMLKKRYDFVILDTASVLNEATLTAFDKADKIFIVIDDEIASIKNAGQTFQLLKKLNYKEDKTDFVVNRFRGKFPLDDEMLLKTLTRKPYARIPLSSKADEACNEGYDIVEKNPGDPAVEGMRQFVVKLAGEWGIPFDTHVKSQKKSKGLLGWFMTEKAS